MRTEHFSSLSPSRDLPRLVAQTGPLDRERHAPWYNISNLSTAETEISLYGVVGEWGITADDFVAELAAIKTQNISLRINSPGGEVMDGIAIYNAIRRHPANVTGYVDGMAASIASVIAMGCDRLVMSPHTQMMIHCASGLVMGYASDAAKFADFLNKCDANIASIYAERAGGTNDHWMGLMQAETTFSDQEAVAAGLADEVLGAPAQDKAPAVTNEVEPEPVAEETTTEEPIDETPTGEPEPIDYQALFSQIVSDVGADELAAFGLGASE